MSHKMRNFAGKNCFTEIIFNIPEYLHHQGLRLLFDKYGDVVDSFIPIKRSMGGSMFDFVCFTRVEDARKAINCADRSWFQGSNIRVFMARFQPREEFWRKKFSGTKPAEVKSKVEGDTHSEAPIVGVVDEDKLLTLRNSLVGWCRKFLRMKELAALLHKEGVLGPKITRLSGLAILIIFENEESRDFALNNQIGALRNCFDKVKVWSEKLQCSSRRAWLSCKGIPSFVWSHSTFRNIAGKWGELISIEEGSVNPGSFDRALLQITTNCQAQVDDYFDLKVGDQIYTIYVSEFEPCFSPESVWVDSSLMEKVAAYPLFTVGELDGDSPVKISEMNECAEEAGRSMDSSEVYNSKRCSEEEDNLLCCVGNKNRGSILSGEVEEERNIVEELFSGLATFVAGQGMAHSKIEEVVEHKDVPVHAEREAENDKRKSSDTARGFEGLNDYFIEFPMLDGRVETKVVEDECFVGLKNNSAFISSKGVDRQNRTAKDGKNNNLSSLHKALGKHSAQQWKSRECRSKFFQSKVHRVEDVSELDGSSLYDSEFHARRQRHKKDAKESL